MVDEMVVDASVVGAAFFAEVNSSIAQHRLTEDVRFIAPDLLRVEMASLASKKVRRSEVSLIEAGQVLEAFGKLVSEFVPAAAHCRRAFELAAQHGVSAYDGLYLAIAEARGVKMLTADARLVARASAVGLGGLVDAL